MHPRRSLLIAAASAAALAAAGSARAQAAAPPQPAPASPLRALGLLPVLGDAIDVSLQDDPAASRMDRAKREVLEVPNLGFDRFVAAEVRRHMTQSLPAVFLHPFGVAGQLPFVQQRQLVADARRGALPGFVLDRVQEHRLSHVLLVARDRVPTSIRTADRQLIGRGEVEGLGFYLDPTYTVENADTRASWRGVLAPHVVVRLALVDVEAARVVAEALIDEQVLVGPPPGATGRPAPWDYLDNAAKVKALRDLLQAGLRRRLPEVLPPAVR